MLDWVDCPVCIYRHPFRVPTERPCPNESLTEARCRAIFNKGLDKVLRKRKLEDMSSKMSSKRPLEDKCPPPVEDIAVGKPAIIKDAAYWREKKRAQRAAAKT